MLTHRRTGTSSSSSEDEEEESPGSRARAWAPADRSGSFRVAIIDDPGGFTLPFGETDGCTIVGVDDATPVVAIAVAAAPVPDVTCAADTVDNAGRVGGCNGGAEAVLERTLDGVCETGAG